MEFALDQALETLLPSQQKVCAQLKTYVQLLWRWNQTYNLTGFKTDQEIFTEFIEQSAQVSPHLQGQFFVDLGTGAGIPGLMLAILRPELSFLLIDSNGKKIRFLQHVIQALQLTHVRAQQIRIEDFKTETPIDGLLTKAFAPLDRMRLLCQHLPIHRFYALKGPQGVEEVTKLKIQSKIIPLNSQQNKPFYLIIIDANLLQSDCK